MTDQAVWKRLNRSTPCLQAMLKSMLCLDDLPPLPEHLRLLAYDGTTLSCPGAQGTDYRLNLGIDLRDRRFHEMYIRDVNMGESLKQFPLQPGDVVVVDRGYCSHAGIVHAVYEHRADVIVRWNHSRQVYDAQQPDQVINFSRAFQGQKPGTITTLPVVRKYAPNKKRPVKDTRELSGHVHLYRMTAAAAQKAGNRVHRTKQKKQKKVSETTLFLSQFFFVFTSLAVEHFSAETVLAIYRCRWQIELAIKRMKRVMHLDKMRAKEGSQLAEASLYGTVLYVLLVDQKMRAHFGEDWGGAAESRAATPWRFYSLLKRRLDSRILAPGSWKLEATASCLHVMMERPCKRKLQCLPRRVVDWRFLLEDLSNAA